MRLDHLLSNNFSHERILENCRLNSDSAWLFNLNLHEKYLQRLIDREREASNLLCKYKCNESGHYTAVMHTLKFGPIAQLVRAQP